MSTPKKLLIAGAGALAALGLWTWIGPDRGVTFPIATGAEGRKWIEMLANHAQLDTTWRQFLVGKSASETAGTFTSNVVLGDPSLYPRHAKPSPSTAKLGPNEARASRQAYDGAVAAGWLNPACGWGRNSYAFGSGGWWSLMPAYAWAAYKDTELWCRNPHYMLHPADQFVCGVEFCRRIMNRASFRSRPDVLSLWIGMGQPNRIDDLGHRANKRNQIMPTLFEKGLDLELLDTTVPPIPRWDIVTQWNSAHALF